MERDSIPFIIDFMKSYNREYEKFLQAYEHDWYPKKYKWETNAL